MIPDYSVGDTFDIKFTTRQFSDGAPTTASGLTVAAYPGNSTTEITAGITTTFSGGFDSRAGLVNVRVVATTGNGYASGTTYYLVATAGTVGGTSIVGEVVGAFTLGRSAAAVRVGTLATAASTGDPGTTTTLVAYLKQLVNILAGSAGIATFPAEAAPANAVSLAEVIRAIHTDVTGINGAAMRGTDNAFLAASAPSNFSDLSVTATTGRVDVASVAGTSQTAGDIIGVLGSPAGASVSADIAEIEGQTRVFERAAAANDIPFLMVDETDGVTPETGLSVTAQRSLDGGAFGSATGTVSEVGNGIYVIDASAADMTADNIIFRMSATGAADTFFHIRTKTT